MAFENIRIRKLTLDELDLKQILEIENLSFNQVDAYNLTDFKRWYGYDPQLCIVAETKENAHIVGYMRACCTDFNSGGNFKFSIDH